MWCAHRVEPRDAARVLLGDGGERARAEDPPRLQRLEVRLDARAAARVRPRYRQHAWHLRNPLPLLAFDESGLLRLGQAMGKI